MDDNKKSTSIKVKNLFEEAFEKGESLQDLDLDSISLDLEGIDIVKEPEVEEKNQDPEPDFVKIELKHDDQNSSSKKDSSSSSHPQVHSVDKIKKILRLAHSDAQESVPKKERYLETSTFIVFDIETSGGNPEKNGITEIYAIKYKKGKILSTFHSLVNPRCRIPALVRKMTGLDNRILKSAPYIEEVMPEFVRFIENYPMVSHNIVGDMKYIDYFALKTTHKELTNKTLCTQLLSEKLFDNLPSKSLSGLMEYFNLTRHEMHRAEGDAYVTLELFKVILSQLKKKNILLVDDALRLQEDLSSCIRLGWKINKTINYFPESKGVLYFYNDNSQLIFATSTLNIRSEFQKLSDFSSLSKYLVKVLVHATDVKYENTSNYLQALLQEARAIDKIANDKIASLIWHNRGSQELLLSKFAKGSYQLEVDVIHKGVFSAIGPVINKVSLVDAIKQILEIYNLPYSKVSLVSSDIVEDLKDCIHKNIDVKIEELEKKSNSLLNIFFKNKKKYYLDRIEHLRSLKNLSLDLPSKDVLEQSGLILIPSSKIVKIYPVVKARVLEEKIYPISYFYQDTITSFKKEFCQLIKKKEKVLSTSLNKLQAALVNAVNYWMQLSYRNKEGFVISYKNLEGDDVSLKESIIKGIESIKGLSSNDKNGLASSSPSSKTKVKIKSRVKSKIKSRSKIKSNKDKDKK